ncbi:MAG: hypothetical protein C0490_25570, partial [Marivirga sp.]|nr:hypothetical protein [Marivirga sp.]
LLLIPEMGIIVKHFPGEFNTIDLLSVMLFGGSIPVLFYGSLYFKDMGPDQLMTIVFFIAIALIVMILFQIPLFILTFVNFFTGLAIWKVRYYNFEQVAE